MISLSTHAKRRDSVNPSGVIYANRLMNCKVKDPQGETIGPLEELVIDAELGVAAYGVIKSGGGFLKSDKLFAVPCDALDLTDDNSGLVLDVENQSLQNAPPSDKDRWPDMADRRWGSSIHAFFGVTPYWEGNRADGERDDRRSSEAASREHSGEEPTRGEQKEDTPVTA